MSSDPISTPPHSGLRQKLDRVGIGLAGLCALHCVATVMLVSGLGIGGHLLLAPEIHEVGLVLAVIVAALAIGWGVLRHRRLAPFAVAMTGLVLMGAAIMVGHGTEEAVLTIVGVFLVSVGHVLNLRSAS